MPLRDVTNRSCEIYKISSVSTQGQKHDGVELLGELMVAAIATCPSS